MVGADSAGLTVATDSVGSADAAGAIVDEGTEGLPGGGSRGCCGFVGDGSKGSSGKTGGGGGGISNNDKKSLRLTKVV